ncbi:carbohydrate ABC transporter ATP-binding protein, CUT1 family [Pseudooceanicola antarcticus]|uniref:Carbohydrate ABC transporter ATP-binding protein, CUT1 family n=1 Tax=Pseudooceanicola antarcticus TaxID=1247613 RepID=A0A285J9K0_9RHOB|nr:ATP-binding cassette domain-containing protein [Pseudooceanicola antarcticus]PJE26922.1 sugar ABC transporter ATP-binding protein [Pseudooceanicola antarcticus]SNY55781.1 carbohydrate ABC transporter ATP-binding protein, CUT1 family [Pseudooceanicola antarcticus]
MAEVRLKNITKQFGPLTVIPDISLTVPDGSFTVLVGPSGCGKSTLLRIISGLTMPSDGEVMIGGEDVTFAEPSDRGISMVFQSYALYPHMTVAQNIDFGLRLAKTPAAEREARVAEAARILALEDYLDRKPGQLSGGQRQRVAIGRSIVRQPKVFLFDEPLSNLDAALRGQMRVELAQLHQSLDATMIYVTHDQVEAMTLADQIVVMNRGQIEQVGAPMELYDRPATEFVAAFIGSPKMNLLPGKAIGRDDVKTVGIRPEHLHADQASGDWPATAKVVETLGADTVVYADAGELGEITVRLPGKMRLTPGEQLFLSPERENLHLFDQDGKRMEDPS